MPLTLTMGVLLLALFEPMAVDGSTLRFREVSEAWNLQFQHHKARTGRYYMVETMGSGVATLDYDGDGDRDVLWVDGSQLPGYEGPTPRTVLFRNDGGRFLDVTESAGLTEVGYGMGVTAADVEGDGDLDLYLTVFGANQLFRNSGNGTFQETGEKAGVSDPSFGASAAFADTDRDGDLDLYVANYVDFSYDNNPVCGRKDLGVRVYCHPDVFDGVPDRFFRNRGEGFFEEATEEVGLAAGRGKGLGVIFTDLDHDGWPDLYVANDMTPNFLYRNRKGEFEEVGLLAGAALSGRGDPEAGMGVDVGDLDGDGNAEILVTHLDNQTNALYGYAGNWVFLNRRFVARLAEPSLLKVGFGVLFLDVDQDGWLDIFVANGHIIDNIELIKDEASFEQSNQVFRNDGQGRFVEVTDAGLSATRSSRGLSAGDLDGDGDLDLVVSNSGARGEVYENSTDGQGAWLQVDLQAGGKNPFAVGAKIEVVDEGLPTQWREVRTGGSYLSQSQLTAHFGLGDPAGDTSIRVSWPGGGRTVLRDVPADSRLRLVRRNNDTERLIEQPVLSP